MAFLVPPSVRTAWLARFAALALLAGVFARSLGASRPNFEPQAEVKVKAAFLLNFAGFVEWPAAAFQSAADAIVIGIYGADPFRDFLDRLVESEVISGRKLEIRRYRPGTTPSGCHILFVSESEARTLPSLLERLRKQPVLTVSNLPGFTEQGGMIQLRTERGRIRFQINQSAAQAAGLTLSSRLLRLSRDPGS
jgi:hypothetical protein